MSKTYSEIVQEIEALKAQAEELKRNEIREVIDRIKHAIEVYGLTAVDLGLARKGRKPGPKPGSKSGAPKAKPTAGKPAAAGVKYRDGNNTWGGRGPRPQWLRSALAAGKSLKDFAV